MNAEKHDHLVALSGYVVKESMLTNVDNVRIALDKVDDSDLRHFCLHMTFQLMSVGSYIKHENEIKLLCDCFKILEPDYDKEAFV